MESIKDMIKDIRPNIKDTSLDTYARNIYRLHKHFKPDNKNIDLLFLFDIKGIMDYLNKNYKDNTKKNIIISITTILDKDKSDKGKILQMEYQNEVDRLVLKINDNITDNTKSDKQNINWADKKEIYSVVRQLKKIITPLLNKEELTRKELDLIQQYILAYLYSGKDIKPLRNDYANMKIVRDGIVVDLDLNFNYLVLAKKPYFLINQYKTSNRYGSLKLDITTKELKETLIKYVSKLGDEQEYLFLNHTTATPITENGLTKYITKIFKKFLNKSIAPSLLRSIYISSIDFSKMSYKTKSKIAREMGHSFDTQQKHYLKIE